MNRLLGRLGYSLARFLGRPRDIPGAAASPTSRQLRESLKPGDVLLVEGSSRVSTAIKYLTQSTWSHAALYVGDALAGTAADPSHCFVEADIVDGVRSIGVEEYTRYHVRICRPVGLSEEETGQVIAHVMARLGHHYDLRNVLDLVRYLLPTPPVSSRLRRRMLALGSGDPTRAICSTLIAQAFQSIHYPILPMVGSDDGSGGNQAFAGDIEELLSVRHHSLFTPRDFDVSPFFEIVKPTLAVGFNFRDLRWSHEMHGNGGGTGLTETAGH